MSWNHPEPDSVDGPDPIARAGGASSDAAIGAAIDAAIGRLRAAGLVDPQPPESGVRVPAGPDRPSGPDRRAARSRPRTPGRAAPGRLVTAWTEGVLLADAG
ncbi:MAG: hypothetical protein ACK5RL_05705 [Acidimicrobiales bacterium]